MISTHIIWKALNHAIVLSQVQLCQQGIKSGRKEATISPLIFRSSVVSYRNLSSRSSSTLRKFHEWGIASPATQTPMLSTALLHQCTLFDKTVRVLTGRSAPWRADHDKYPSSLKLLEANRAHFQTTILYSPNWNCSLSMRRIDAGAHLCLRKRKWRIRSIH